jgi:hypothetical protein
MRKLRLVDAGNAESPALAVIIAKGYTVYLLPDDRDEYLGDFWAIKEGRDFIASDPLRLLGLIALWEYTGDDWQALKGDFYRQVIDRAFPEEEHYKTMDEAAFQQEMTHYQPFFEALRLPMPIAPLDLFHVLANLSDILNRRCDDGEE